jgi:methylthioribose-1-phosphate isomerase
VLTLGETRIAPAGVGALNPAFDVTPARLIRSIYTERGITAPADVAGLAKPDAGH